MTVKLNHYFSITPIKSKEYKKFIIKKFIPGVNRLNMHTVAVWSVMVGAYFLAKHEGGRGTLLGGVWANESWGRYWGWDPKETSALVTWLIYAVYLHARGRRGWAGRPAALILVIGFGAVLFTYFGNLFFSGLHAYSGL